MRKGSLIQITNEEHHWFPAILIVDEVKSWGVQAYLTVVNNNSENNGNAFIRLNNDEFECIEDGMAIIVVA